jgi:hypothetical protein
MADHRPDAEEEGSDGEPHRNWDVWDLAEKALPFCAFIAEGEGTATRLLMLLVVVLVILGSGK